MWRFIIVGVFAGLAASQELLSAVVLHRHGDRNPFTTFKTDLYKDERHWPEGFGQLTKTGIQRQYALGLWLKARYGAFLPPRYNPHSIRAVSTDVDRTLMSAEVTLAGLFPPSVSEKFHENINWQPVPVHTSRPEVDPVLAMKKPCKKYQRMFQQLMKSKDITEINDINKNLYEFLSNKTGEEMNDVYDVEVIYNALNTQFLANKILPEWALEVYPEKMKPAVLLRFKLPCYNRDLARLRTGLLMGQIVQNFQSLVNGGKGLNLLLLSGHDATLADVLTTLGAFNNEVPAYSSAVLLELYRTNQGHFVNVFFKNSTGLHPILIETCNFNCSFDNFIRILAPIVQPNQEQWEKECEN